MGCNYTAAFCRKEKARPFKILENNLTCQVVFDRVGLQEKKNEDSSTEIEKYVCAVYGRKRLASVNESTFGDIYGKLQSKGKQVNFKYEKV